MSPEQYKQVGDLYNAALDLSPEDREKFLKHYQEVRKITILLTSHYMKDVAALCKRVVVINHGQIVYDGSLSGIIDRFSSHKVLTLLFSEPPWFVNLVSQSGTIRLVSTAGTSLSTLVKAEVLDVMAVYKPSATTLPVVVNELQTVSGHVTINVDSARVKRNAHHPNMGRTHKSEIGISMSYGMGGHNAGLLFKRYDR